jgi:hypothetical protein
MTRGLIPIGECGLLSRPNAMRYCGQIGEERFDREVAPHGVPAASAKSGSICGKTWTPRPGGCPATVLAARPPPPQRTVGKLPVQ